MTDGVTVGIILRRASDRHSPFGPMTGFFHRVMQAGRRLDVTIIGFPPDEVRRYRKGINAVVWNAERSRFSERRMPVPDLVWDRLKGPRGEPAVALLRQLGVPLLNTVVLNKWEAIQVLSRDPVLHGLMPHTRLLGDPDDVLEIVQRHGRAYLKPVVGSMGRGILRLLRHGRRYLGQSVPGGRGEVESELLAEDDLEDWLDHQVGGRRYLVQQGLQLEVFRGRTTDIRILMQKNGHGHWGVTGMGARVGAPGRFTSNLHTGGQGIPVPYLLAALMPGDAERQTQVLSAIARLGQHICRVLERAMGPLGELGIDLGLEPDGRLWYIEHNYYPGRSIFRHLGQQDVWEMAHRRPLEYAIWAVNRTRRHLPLLLPESEDLPQPTASAPSVGNPAGRVLRPATGQPLVLFGRSHVSAAPGPPSTAAAEPPAPEAAPAADQAATSPPLGGGELTEDDAGLTMLPPDTVRPAAAGAAIKADSSVTVRTLTSNNTVPSRPRITFQLPRPG